MQTPENAPENSIASFIPLMGFEEQPLWAVVESMLDGTTADGTMVIRFIDNDTIEQYNGQITAHNGGILFEEY